jgi:hypothetical protein
MRSKDQPAAHSFQSGRTTAHVVGTHRGKRFVLYSARRGGFPIWYTYTVRYLGVQFAHTINAKLLLRSTTNESALLKSIFRGRAFRTGDERFDDRFILECSVPGDFAVRLLSSAGLHQQLLEVLTGLRRRRIELEGQWLILEEIPASYTLEGGSDETAYVRRMVELMVSIAEAIEQLAG